MVAAPSRRGSEALSRLVRKVEELEVTAEKWRRQRQAEEEIAKELATLNTMPSMPSHLNSGRCWGLGRRRSTAEAALFDLDEFGSDEGVTTDDDYSDAEFDSSDEQLDGEEEEGPSSASPWYGVTPRSQRLTTGNRTYFDLFGLDEEDHLIEVERLRKVSLGNAPPSGAAVLSGSAAAPKVCVANDDVDEWYSSQYSLEAEGGVWYRDPLAISKYRRNIEEWRDWDRKVQLQRLQAIMQAGSAKKGILARQREEEREEKAEEKRLKMIEEKKKIEAEKRKAEDAQKAAAEVPVQSPKKIAAPAQQPLTPDFARQEIAEKPVPVAVKVEKAETLASTGLKALTDFTDIWGRKAQLSKKYRPAWKEICTAAQQVSSTRKSISQTAGKAARVLIRNKGNAEAVKFLACASVEKLISCSINNSLDFVWTTAYHIRMVAEELKASDEPAVTLTAYLHALVGCMNFKCPWISWIDVHKAHKAALKHVDSSDWFKEQETFVSLWLALMVVFQDVATLWQWIDALVAEASNNDPSLPMLVNCYLRVPRYDLITRWLGPMQGAKLERLFAGPIRDCIRSVRSAFRSSAVVEYYGLLCETALDSPTVPIPSGMQIATNEESDLNSNV